MKSQSNGKSQLKAGENPLQSHIFDDRGPLARARKKSLMTGILQLAAVSGVLALIFLLAFRGSDLLLVIFSALFLGVAVMLINGVRRAIVAGEFQGRSGLTSRYESPGSFWFQIAQFIVAAGVCVFFGLSLIALHWAK